MFLREHTPELLRELSHGLHLVTTKCSCEYLAEVFAFDEITIRMRLADLTQNRMTLGFEYWRRNGNGGADELVARGDQQVIVMRTEGDRTVPAPIPPALREALRPYGET